MKSTAALSASHSPRSTSRRHHFLKPALGLALSLATAGAFAQTPRVGLKIEELTCDP